MTIEDIKKTLRDFEDFPSKGITFKDISPILQEPDKLKFIIREMARFVEKLDADVIVAPDARGFIFGIPLALELNKPFVMIRKDGKLPGKVFRETYDLEYATSALEMQEDSIKPNQRVVIVDDIIATGGTSKAIENLVKKAKGKIVGHVYLLSIFNINFAEILDGEIYSMFQI
ncbi:MAG: adenine phosphoribosyltransferase [Mycoplasmoidaceae bacterium]